MRGHFFRPTVRLAVLAGVLGVMAGCGEDRLAQPRKEFIAGCAASGGTRETCACVFQKIEATYPTEQILRIAQGQVPADFGEVVARSAQACVKPR